jgi:hypothetical protein
MMRTHRSIRPSLEALETRDTPAGTVTATFAAGRLTLTGDAADNTVLITLGADDRLTVSGDGSGTVIRLNGDPAGDSVTLPAPVTGAVSIALGDGADVLTVDAVDLPGSLTIDGGNGATGGPGGNAVILKGGVLVGGDLSITNLAGADATYLTGMVNVEGDLTIQNGRGGSLVLGDKTTDLRVGGVLSVAGAAGFDKVDLWGAVAVSADDLAFDSGPDRAGSYYRVHPFGDLTVAGAVRVTNGPGPDLTDLGGQNLTVGGAVVIQNGDGDTINTLLTWGTMSVGRIAITNGAGNDLNTIHTYDKALIRGGVTIGNGSGGSDSYIGDGNLLSVGGNISFVNGSGRDLNSVYSAEARIDGAITVRNGGGDSDTSIAAETRLLVGGPTRITSGTGKDDVAIGSGRVGDTAPAVDVGPVLVDNGDGGSDTEILGSRLTVRGSVNVAAWDGTDQVIVASVIDNGSVAGRVLVDVGPGDQQVVAVGAADGRVLTIGGGLGIWADRSVGVNAVSLSGANVRSWTEIGTGDGADQIQVTGSTFGGEFDLYTGAADDTIKLEWAGGATYFRGPVWVYTGDGNDQVWLAGNSDGGGAGGQAVFAAASTWRGGTGTDFLIGRNLSAIFLGGEPDVRGYEATV